MRKYIYENATVYITEPTEKHMNNIRKATEIFLKKVVKEELQHESRAHNRRISPGNINARKRNRKIKEEN